MFDSSLGVYAVVGVDDHFFYDGNFFRHSAARWEVSVRFGGGWVVTQQSHVPQKLARRAHRRAHKAHSKKHRGRPAKHAH